MELLIDFFGAVCLSAILSSDLCMDLMYITLLSIT